MHKLEEPRVKDMTGPASLKKAEFQRRPPDICVCAYSSDHTRKSDHFDIISRCLLSIVKNTPPNFYRLHIGCNNLSPRALALVDWMVDRYGAVKYIGEPQQDPNGNTIFPKYPLMRKIYDATAADWVIWFDDDCYVSQCDWLEQLEEKINTTPAADQFGDHSLIVVSPEHKACWIEPADWYNPDKLEYRDFPDGRKIVAAFVRGGFYALSRRAIDACDIPDRRLVHNNGDWTTGMALTHQGFTFAHHLRGITIGEEPRRGIHEDKSCPNGQANQKRLPGRVQIHLNSGETFRCRQNR